MKKIFIGLSILVLMISFKVSTDSVYICDSTTASVYHSTENCRGLNKCTHPIKKISKNDAINKYGRRACKICY